MNCITLLSDLGSRDASVAMSKGILMQHVPSVPIIDISHEVMPFHTGEAAYLLTSSWRSFPQGSCHLVLFDLFAGRTNRLILCAHEGHYFLAADNGVLPLALANSSAWLVKELDPSDTFSAIVTVAAETILRLQTIRAGDLGLPAHTPKAAPAQFIPAMQNDHISCEVLHIDSYENVILNVTQQQFDQMGNGKPFRLEFLQAEEINDLSRSFNDVREGYKLCRFNSNGFLEIGVNHGKAASLFGLRLGGRHNKIKLYFE